MSTRKNRRGVDRAQTAHSLYFEALEARVLLSSQPTAWTSLGVGQGGTSYYADVNPLNSNEIYLETDMGEVWHTTDDGLHWTTLNMQTQIHSNAIGNGVQYTSNANIQYAISGGNTPFVTNDDGQDWTQLKGWAAVAANDGGSAARLLVDPTNTNRLILMEQKQVGNTYKWWNYYSTDGGNTFALVNTGGAGASDTSGTDTTELWAAGAYWNGSTIMFASNKGLYSSSNGGTSWTFTSSASMSKPNNASGFDVLTGGTNAGVSDIISFAASSSGGTTRLYAITWDASYHSMSVDTGSLYTGLYTSTNGGASWSRIDGTTFGAGQTIPLLPKWVQVLNGNTNNVWVAGSDVNTSSPIVYSSTNAGSTWTRLFKSGANPGAFPGETPNQNVFTRTFGAGSVNYGWGYIAGAVTFDLVNSNVMTFTSMGTIFGTFDGGANWYDLSAGGPNQLPNTDWNAEGANIPAGASYINSQANETSIWNATIINPNTIFLDSTDVAGEVSTNGGSTWKYLTVPGVSNPNTFYQSVYVPSTDTLYAVTSNKHDIFTNNIDDGEIEQFGANYLVMSKDHGATWTILHTFPVGAPARTLAIDPNNPNVAYVGLDNSTAGTGGIWKTTDLQDGASSVWVNLSTQPHRDIDNNGTQDFADFYPDQITILNDGTIVAVSAVRLANSGDYQSSNNLSYTAGVWVSTDGGATWSDRSSVNGTGSDIYNNGQDMYDTAGNLLSTEAFSVTVDPNDPTQNTWFATTYYFGTQDYGTIYKSTNRGQTWTNWMQWPNGAPGTGVVGQAENLWIQPGGTVMLATTKLGLYYTPNYTAATPIFYPVQNFPFNGSPSFQIISDPFNTNKVYVTTFGGGIWMTDVSQLSSGGIVQNLTAKTMSGTEVMLNWNVTAPLGTSYIIQTSTDQTTWTNAATAPSWQETSYLVGGLSTNTLYYFRVLSVGLGGNSAPSAVASTYTDGSGLAASEEVTQAAGALNGTGSGTGWSSTWSANSSGDTVVAGNINGSNPPDNTGNYISITTSGVDASRTLSSSVGAAGSVVWVSFEVNTADGSNILLGNSTNGIGFGTQNYSSWPSFISIRNGVMTYEQSQTSTTAGNHFYVARLEYRNDGTVYVRLFQDPTPGLSYPNNELTLGNGWSAVFTAAQLPATLLTNQVTLTKPSFGTASYDEIRVGGTYLAVAPKTGTAAPAAPSGIAGTVVNQNSVNLSWTNNSTNQQGFTVEEFNGSTWSTLERLYNTSTSGSVVNYSVTNLNAASTYQFRVSAFNAAGSSATNATGNLTTLVNAPSPVTTLAVAVNAGQFNLTWSDVSGETGYTIQYADATGLRTPYNDGELAWQTVTPNLPANSTSYSFTTLSTNKLYYFRIYAFNAGGTSMCSNTPSATSFPAPTGLAASPVSDTQALLSWTNTIVGETGYTAQYSTDGSTWTTGATAAAGATQVLISGLSSNTVYYFRLQAFAPGSTGLWSSSVSARTYATIPGTIATDGFSYLTGPLSGNNGGSGWATAWSSPAGATIASGSLTGPTGFLTSGNHLNVTQQSSESRTTSTTFGANGTTTWFSFLVTIPSDSASAVLQLGTSAHPIQIGDVWNGTFGVTDGNDLYLGGSVTAVAGQTYFIVASIDNEASSETYNVWVNPTPGLSSPNGTADATRTITADDFQATNTLAFETGTYFNSAAFDELRVGTTYAAVSPLTVPAAPTGLSATAVSTSQINLSWTNPSGTTQTGLHVQRSTDDVNFTTVATINTPTTTTYSDTGLAGSTLYYYRITGFNNSGDSLYSNTANATTQGSIPAAPSGLTATTISQTQINLAWTDNSSNETGFEVDQATNSSFTTGLVTYNVGVNVTAYNDTGLAANTTYYFRVRALGSSGNSAFTSTANATSLANAPTSLSATAASSSQINLTWSESGTATSYKIYRAPDVSGSPGTFTLDSTSSTTSFSDTGLSASTKYWYQVTAVNSAGAESAHSNQANATTSAASANIASDSFSYSAGSLNGDGTSGSGWAGAWSANSNPTVSTTSLVPTVNLATSGGSFTTTVAGYGATRNLSSALNSNGTTVWSSVLITPDFAGPNTPRSGSITVGNTEVDYVQESDGNYHWEINALDGSWYGSHYNAGTNPTVTTGQTYFVVIEQIFNSGSDTVYAWINPTPGSTAPSTASAFDTKTGVNAGGTLTAIKLGSTYYSNTAFDEVRIGTTYAAVAPLGATAPNAPSALSATAASSSQINLTWTDNATNETGFKVYQSTNGTSFSLLQTIATPNTTSYNVTGLSGSTQYWYEVTAYNSVGESSDSNVATTMTAIAGGIASDSFSYAAGHLNGDGTAGNGWAGAWSGNNNPTVSTTSLSPTVNLATSGGSFSTTVAGYGATRNLSSALNTNSTVWSSVLITPDYAGPNTPRSGSITVGNTNVLYMQQSDGNYYWDIDAANGSWYGSHWNSTSNPTAVSGTTYFVVLEQIFSGGSDTVYAWINPTPGATAPSTASAFDTKTGVNAGGTLTTVKLGSTYYSNTAFDEVRIGTTYASVAPPQISGLTINSTHSSSYSIHNRALATGVSQYGDVTKNFTTIPSQYLGLTYIQTAEADSTSTAANLISFTVYQPTIVYVVFDDAITTKPTWLTSQFTDTGDNIVSAQGTFSVYKMTVSAGLVTLGGPGGTSGQGMYSVLLQSAV